MTVNAIGTIAEIKDNENLVGLTPSNVEQLVAAGKKVVVQTNAGEGSGFPDNLYLQAGATLVETPEEVLSLVDILVKVKEPIPEEYPLLDTFQGKTLYTYLHLSGVDPELTERLLRNNITAIAYETVIDENGLTPLLAPMSEVAGVLAIQYGAQYIQKKYGGIGTTLGQVTGTDLPRTVVVGAGVVGLKAALSAVKLGGIVDIFDISQAAIQRAENFFNDECTNKELKRISVLASEPQTLNPALQKADLVVGAVLVAGARAPRVISEKQIKSLKPGAVVVDVAIDQGGCIWGAKATTHTNPIYTIGDVIFCCVANMPGQAARQSTQALTSATFPFLLAMAENGVEQTLRSNDTFRSGVNTYQGKITYESVAKDLNRENDFQAFI